jgi:hypothetical protein
MVGINVPIPVYGLARHGGWKTCWRYACYGEAFASTPTKDPSCSAGPKTCGKGAGLMMPTAKWAMMAVQACFYKKKPPVRQNRRAFTEQIDLDKTPGNVGVDKIH